MPRLQGIGIWSSELRYGDRAEAAELAAELDELGFTALWVPDVGGPLLDDLDHLLAATSTTTVATGILNVWMHDAADVAAWWSALAPEVRDRLLLGLGVSHGALIGDRWTKPVEKVGSYLDALAAAPDAVPPDQLCIAALGPRMLRLAGDRTAGSCPYLVTPDHTAIAREALGDGALYVEQGYLLEGDADVARATARQVLGHYFGLPNYANNWKRLGFTDDDIASRSDRLIDALVAWGDLDAVAARVDAHLAAGADHVCLQALVPFGTSPRESWRQVAPLLTR